MPNIFLKLLRSQESGYSGDRPDQRGKYVLIPGFGWEAFPPLSRLRLNDQTPIVCEMLTGESIAVNLVYHNAKYFGHLGLTRAHNEVRLYRNVSIDKALNLDRYVVIGFIQTETMGHFKVFSIQPNEEIYETWARLAKQNRLFDSTELPQTGPLNDFSNQVIAAASSISNQDEIFESIASLAVKQRQQQPGLEGDPASMLATLIKSQKDFSNYLRQAFGGKCALRGTPLINNSFTGLDAAHIQPHSHGGPLLPTNGILLSKDLHHAFESGAFTLDANNKVLINPNVPRNSSLRLFSGKVVTPEPDFEIFKPYSGYINYHTENLYDRYTANAQG